MKKTPIERGGLIGDFLPVLKPGGWLLLLKKEGGLFFHGEAEAHAVELLGDVADGGEGGVAAEGTHGLKQGENFL